MLYVLPVVTTTLSVLLYYHRTATWLLWCSYTFLVHKYNGCYGAWVLCQSKLIKGAGAWLDTISSAVTMVTLLQL